jgi:hypothetical protein
MNSGIQTQILIYEVNLTFFPSILSAFMLMCLPPGTVRLTREGEVRWTSISVFQGFVVHSLALSMTGLNC